MRVWDQDNRLSDYSAARSFQVIAPTASFFPANNVKANEVNPVSLVKTNATAYFIDFGKNALGCSMYAQYPIDLMANFNLILFSLR